MFVTMKPCDLEKTTTSCPYKRFGWCGRNSKANLCTVHSESLKSISFTVKESETEEGKDRVGCSVLPSAAMLF